MHTVNQPAIHNHAIERLQERFGIDEEWLLQELENGRFVWLKGFGDSGDAQKVRSGHLLYLPQRDEYCVVIMDDRVRLAITVLTEEMALRSSWSKGLDRAAKLKAKKIAMGAEEVADSNFLRLYAEERGCVSVSVRARTYSYEWKPVVVTLCKVCLEADQINPIDDSCTLSQPHLMSVSQALMERVENKEIRPYCELFVSTTNDKSVKLANKIEGVSSLDEAEYARRWGSA